jgi:hypothetical protein
MSHCHHPISPGEEFQIRPAGKGHTAGDIDCPACGIVDGIRYPTPHCDRTIVHLEFLVHGEAFEDAFDRYCEGGCIVPAIKFAPQLPERQTA